MYLTVQALVLRITDYKERDAIITLLTRDHGRMSVKVRGLRHKKSPHTAACQLLSVSEFTLFEYQGKYTVNESRSIELFQGLRRDLQKLSLATYFAQVTEAITQEELPNTDQLSLVLNSLYALSYTQESENKIKASFELKTACYAGYLPDLGGCMKCGNTYADRFNVSAGVMECSACRDENSTGLRIPISPTLMDAMRYIVSCDQKRMLAFTLPEEDMIVLSQTSELYLTTQLERGFSSLDFYKSLLIN